MSWIRVITYILIMAVATLLAIKMHATEIDWESFMFTCPDGMECGGEIPELKKSVWYYAEVYPIELPVSKEGL